MTIPERTDRERGAAPDCQAGWIKCSGERPCSRHAGWWKEYLNREPATPSVQAETPVTTNVAIYPGPYTSAQSRLASPDARELARQYVWKDWHGGDDAVKELVALLESYGLSQRQAGAQAVHKAIQVHIDEYPNLGSCAWNCTTAAPLLELAKKAEQAGLERAAQLRCIFCRATTDKATLRDGAWIHYAKAVEPTPCEASDIRSLLPDPKVKA